MQVSLDGALVKTSIAEGFFLGLNSQFSSPRQIMTHKAVAKKRITYRYRCMYIYIYSQTDTNIGISKNKDIYI